MKKLNVLIGLMLAMALLFSCQQTPLEEIIGDENLKIAKMKAEKLTGFDQWGYNWNAHQFKGYLINAWFGDEIDPSAPWYKKAPPYNGDWEGYASDHPEVWDYSFWYYGNMTLVMHWNESAISSEGVYQYPILDTDAWISFHYRAGEGKDKWSQFQKYVAAKSTDYAEILFYDGDSPVYGKWYSAEGHYLGDYYLWPDRILIQVVNTGNVPEGMLAGFKSPMGPGLGQYYRTGD